MAEGNRSVFLPLVCSLIFMISVISIQVTGWNSVDECKDELFVKLDDDKWSDDEVESILKQENPDRLVGAVTVGQLLDFRDTTCNLEGLTSDHFYLPRHYWCEKKVWNKGIMKFDFKYQRERRKACAEKIFPLVEKALEEVSTEHRARAEKLDKYQGKNFEQLRLGYCRINDAYCLIRAYLGYSFGLNRTERRRKKLRDLSDSCTLFIRAMATLDLCSKLTDVSEEHEGIKHWFNVMETCRAYIQARCHCDARCRYCDREYDDCTVYTECCFKGNPQCRTGPSRRETIPVSGIVHLRA